MNTKLRFYLVLLAILSTGCQQQASADDENSPGEALASNGDAVMPPESTSQPSEAASSNQRHVVIRGDLQAVDWKSMIGKQVRIEGTLEVVDTYDLVRYGEVKVARERLRIPTSYIDPNDADAKGVSFNGGSNVAKVVAAQKSNDKGILVIDDGAGGENIFPPKLFPELGRSEPTVRIGSVVENVSGRIVKQRNTILLVSNGPLKWTPARRPARPDLGAADITIASFNVLNYFTTIDNGRNKARGADSKSELVRQNAKVVAAINQLQADVVGLMEIENSPEAEERLVEALNKASGKNVFKGCGVPAGFRNAPGGTDAIRVALIYRADRVTPAGDVEMIRDNAFYAARTPVVQTFKPKRGGKPFTVVVNHFKSKGGAKDADAANKNKGDGQGAYNATRLGQTMAIVKFVQGLKSKKRRVLILGDLNAYQQEDPIDALRAGGLVDLHEAEQSEEQGEAYSYVYYGQSGSLDHAFATEGLAQDVTGVATWHINADEPRFLDYNEEFNPKSLFEPDPFRSSDHDPVLIGIKK